MSPRYSEDVIVEIAQEENDSKQEGDSISNRDTDPCTTSCECVEARKRLKGYCETALFRVYCCTFKSLLEEEERIIHDSIDFSLAESSMLLLTEPPSLTSEHISGSDVPVLSEEQGKRFVECTKDIVKVGGHAINFCSAMDFPRWVTFFKSCTYEDGRTPSFEVDEILFLLLEDMDSERGQSTYGKIFHFAMHAERIEDGVKSSPYHQRDSSRDDGSCEKVGHGAVQLVQSTFSPTSHVLDNAPLAQKSETVHRRGFGDVLVPLHRDEKSQKLLQELLYNFTIPKDIVVDPFERSFATGIACMTLPENEIRYFVGCEAIWNVSYFLKGISTILLLLE